MSVNVDCFEYLKKYSIKPSVQRVAVLDFLMKNRTHPTIDEIYLALSPIIPTLSKTTVYNTLNLFVDKEAVRELQVDEKNARYDIELKDHAHCLCKNCSTIIDVFSTDSSLFQKPSIQGFSIIDVEVSYIGICDKCLVLN